MILRNWQKKFWATNITLLLLVQNYYCYKLTSVEQAIIGAFTSLGDIRNDFSRHFLEAISLPVLAPILVRSGALFGDKSSISPSYVQDQIKNAGIGTFLHGLSLLPITLPVSAVHLLSAPVAIPYRRRVGRALENQLRKDIAAVVLQLHQLADYTDKQSYNLNYINVVPQNTLEHSTLEFHENIPPIPLIRSSSSSESQTSVPVAKD
jgi:hypothetical protein